MDYFSYLRMTYKEDTKDNFEDYLIEVLGYSIQDAKKESDFMYREGED